MSEQPSSAENDAPLICAITKSEWCHLRGVRYDAKPCIGSCDLASDGGPMRGSACGCPCHGGHLGTGCRQNRCERCIIPPGSGDTP